MMIPRPRIAAAFTLIELIVSVAILLILITSVGLVFSSASRSVGTSQAVMDLLSNTTAVQQQMESDVTGMNKNGFLVIRCGTFQDPVTGLIRRGDQIAFLARGNFVHRTGENNGGSPFTDGTTSPNALVWWGQLAIEQGTASPVPLNPRVYPKPNQSYHVLLTQVPTGQSDGDFVLGRSAMLLLPKNTSTTNQSQSGIAFGAYQNVATSSPPTAAIDYSAAPVAAITAEGTADITESRVDAAAASPTQIMGYLQQAITGSRSSPTLARYEADHYCYRRAALESPYDTEILSSGVTSFPNGYFRMHTVALQGVPSFSVDWTDGSVYNGTEVDVLTGTTVAASRIGTTKWYGMYQPPTGATPVGLAKGGAFAQYLIDLGSTSQTAPDFNTSNGDSYTAVFSFDNKPSWPVALRFRYHIADPSGRLPGGRDVVQVIKLPS